MPERKAARQQLADGRKQTLDRKKRTRRLIRMGGVLAAYGFDSPEQTGTLLGDFVRAEWHKLALGAHGVTPAERWSQDTKRRYGRKPLLLRAITRAQREERQPQHPETHRRPRALLPQPAIHREQDEARRREGRPSHRLDRRLKRRLRLSKYPITSSAAQKVIPDRSARGSDPESTSSIPTTIPPITRDTPRTARGVHLKLRHLGQGPAATPRAPARSSAPRADRALQPGIRQAVRRPTRTVPTALRRPTRAPAREVRASSYTPLAAQLGSHGGQYTPTPTMVRCPTERTHHEERQAMEYFWLATVITWISGLVFGCRVISPRLGHPLAPRQAREQARQYVPGHGYPTAEEILRHRFVTGEISTEEYERLLEVLFKHPLSTPPLGAQPRPRQTPPISPRGANSAEIRVRAEPIKRAAAGLAATMGYATFLLADSGFNYEEGGLNAALLTLTLAICTLVAATRALT